MGKINRLKTNLNIYKYKNQAKKPALLPASNVNPEQVI